MATVLEFKTKPEVLVTCTEVVAVGNEVPPNVLIIAGDALLCYGQQAVLSSSYGEGNQWLLDGWPIPNETASTITVENEGNYSVQVTNTSGLVLNSNTVAIQVLPPIINDFTADRQALSSGKTTVNFSADLHTMAQVTWDFGDPNSNDNQSNLLEPSHEYRDTGVYTVTLMAQDQSGCIDTLIKENYIEYRIGPPQNNNGQQQTAIDLWIPNAFSPNDDGRNDRFSLLGSDVAFARMYIYNQWGELVYAEESSDPGWNGIFQGELAQNSTYTYCVEVTTPSGITVFRTGHVSLVR
ncbi:MAG: gliding motility-associated C-terminal domain-containing protein [Bacteroidota bacterium]